MSDQERRLSEELARHDGTRPREREIDFVRAVRQCERSRTAAQVALLSLSVCGVALIGYLLLPSVVLLVVVALSAASSTVAAVVRSRLEGAEVPRLPR